MCLAISTASRACGHPPALLSRRDGSLERLGATCPVVGLFERWDCALEERQLAAGDTVLLYTDGVTEAEDRDRNLFQDERLKEAFSQHQDSSLKTLQDGIWSAIEKFTEGANQSDDVTLLVVRYRGSAEGIQKN